jgi:hypothetical protein
MGTSKNYGFLVCHPEPFDSFHSLKVNSAKDPVDYTGFFACGSE